MLWIPPKSPHGLLQEELWPNEWKILVSCLLLNLTTRQQVDAIYEGLFERYPTPETMALADEDKLRELIMPLGLANKRAKTLIRFSKEYLIREWSSAKDLYGCGKYADDAWRIFCMGDWSNVEPTDHALNNYHNYLKQNLGEKGA